MLDSVHSSIYSLPIETAYTINDIAYNISIDENGNFIQQPIINQDKFNRYYFDYPAEWKASDTGEQMVGLRSIWIHKKKCKLEFQLCIRTYTKENLLKQLKNKVQRYPDFTNISQLLDDPPTDDEIETNVKGIPNGYLTTYNIPIYIIKTCSKLYSIVHAIHIYLMMTKTLTFNVGNESF